MNAADAEDAERELLDACGSRVWARAVASRRPFADAAALREAVERAFDELDAEEWEEALAAHPRIGARADAGRQSARGERWSAGEQAGVERSPDFLARLVDGNRRYEAKFDRAFVVRAAGRSGDEILAELERRLALEPATELAEAADQQREITRLRIDRMLAA
jgi:OHCU decarboxylase